MIRRCNFVDIQVMHHAGETCSLLSKDNYKSYCCQICFGGRHLYSKRSKYLNAFDGASQLSFILRPPWRSALFPNWWSHKLEIKIQPEIMSVSKFACGKCHKFFNILSSYFCVLKWALPSLVSSPHIETETVNHSVGGSMFRASLSQSIWKAHTALSGIALEDAYWKNSFRFKAPSSFHVSWDSSVILSIFFRYFRFSWSRGKRST